MGQVKGGALDKIRSRHVEPGRKWGASAMTISPKRFELSGQGVNHDQRAIPQGY